MSISTNSNEKGLSIVLAERFDFGEVDRFRRCYESVKVPKGKSVKIDFKNTRYIDSSALGMLINAKDYLGGSEVKIKLVNANEQIKKIFSISRFDMKFDIE
ncbi:MAG: STAS domain-containing protein [Cellvibrionaceae bacterium]|nr:STAS domain-containing protein [Cellvibrionaceae bacterium]